MKKENITRIVLSAIIGVIIGLVLTLLGESTAALANSIVMAFVLTVVANAFFSESSLRMLINIIVFLVAFFVYGGIVDWANYLDSFIGLILWAILYFGPFAAIVFIFSSDNSETETE